MAVKKSKKGKSAGEKPQIRLFVEEEGKGFTFSFTSSGAVLWVERSYTTLFISTKKRPQNRLFLSRLVRAARANGRQSDSLKRWLEFRRKLLKETGAGKKTYFHVSMPRLLGCYTPEEVIACISDIMLGTRDVEFVIWDSREDKLKAAPHSACPTCLKPA